MTQMTTCDLHNETIARLERELNEAMRERNDAIQAAMHDMSARQRAERVAQQSLAAKPDVAGLVKRLREGDHGFDRNGSHSEDRYVCLCEHLANEAATALLSLSAQLSKLQKNAGAYRKDYLLARDREDKLSAQLQEMTAECEEQARLNGMGSEREAKLMAEIARLEGECAALRELIKNIDFHLARKASK